MGEIFLDALIDSLIVLAVLVPVNILIAVIEPRLAGRIRLKGRLAPLVGVTVGLFPQCGFSVVATDLYQKRHITVGTLLGVYLATSDEALPIFLSAGEKALDILPILAFKFAIGLIVGYTADLVCTKSRARVENHAAECEHEPEIHIGCCGHNIEEDEQKSEHDHSECEEPCGEEKELAAKNRAAKLRQYLLHPLEHSARTFLYIFVINLIFGVIIHFVGEDALMEFLSSNRYVAPLFAVIVGAIPNCASSVVISDLYLMGGLGFGATLGGLLMNAGIGFAVLFRDRKAWRENLAIFAVMFLVSVAFAYILSACYVPRLRRLRLHPLRLLQLRRFTYCVNGRGAAPAPRRGCHPRTPCIYIILRRRLRFHPQPSAHFYNKKHGSARV